MLKIKRALISVSDKTGILDLAKLLVSFDVEIISTGGTAKILKDAGIAVIEMSDYTGFPEMLDGRVKTLHPKIHAGLLAIRDNKEHMEKLREHNIGLIDMVVVNLYPFEKIITREGVGLHEAIENIDIGGPSMLRSAAKNYQSVAVISDAKFYLQVADELKKNNGCLSNDLLKKLAVAVFERTSSYDAAIAGFLQKKLGDCKGDVVKELPSTICIELKKAASLRYGENPHQKAGLYQDMAHKGSSLISARQLSGKELSFNNYLDLNAALEIAREFDEPTACIIKHTNPTGVACASSLDQAYKLAFQSDSLSAFGGIIGLNKKVDDRTAKAIIKSGFMECVVAPAYDATALEILKAKKNLRLLEVEFDSARSKDELDLKNIDGGVLIQEPDIDDAQESDWKVVTKKKPAKREIVSLLFAWKVVKFVKSNAIVLVNSKKTVGIGMGQTSRVDSVFMAIKRAGSRSRGAVMASDAFFPKADNIALAKKYGIKAIVQPGGSIADEEVIRAADKAGIAMLFTGMRHFRH